MSSTNAAKSAKSLTRPLSALPTVVSNAEILPSCSVSLASIVPARVSRAVTLASVASRASISPAKSVAIGSVIAFTFASV